MSKKKRFVISQSLERGLSDTINAVKNNAGTVRFEVIALSRIETDPENPRELALTPADIREFHHKGKPAVSGAEKLAELESLQQLADTITQKGLINPVVVYKHGETYRLVAGERRFLASLLAKKEDIQARILNEKPKNLDLRLLQWIENTEREDLSLRDRIGNVRSILRAYQKEHPATTLPLSATLLKDLIGISLPQASCYLAVLNAPQDIAAAIAHGDMNNLDKAAFVAKITDESLRKQLISACQQGQSLKQLRGMVEQARKVQQAEKTKPDEKKKRGRAARQIQLGVSHKPAVIKKLMTTLLSCSPYQAYARHFAEVEWQALDKVTKAFQKLIKLLETEGVE